MAQTLTQEYLESKSGRKELIKAFMAQNKVVQHYKGKIQKWGKFYIDSSGNRIMVKMSLTDGNEYDPGIPLATFTPTPKNNKLKFVIVAIILLGAAAVIVVSYWPF